MMTAILLTTLQVIQKEVQTTALKAYEERLVAGTSGNVSFYDRKNQLLAITPSNLDYKIMTPSDIVIMDLAGNQLPESNGYQPSPHKPSSEWQMHAEIYRGLPHVSAILHTHSPRATSFAVLHEEIPVILVEMLPYIGGDIPRAAFALPGTIDLGKKCVEALTNRQACLLDNHGVVAVGETLNNAYTRAIYVEDAAKIYHFSRQLGTPKLVPNEAIETLKTRYNLPD